MRSYEDIFGTVLSVHDDSLSYDCKDIGKFYSVRVYTFIPQKVSNIIETKEKTLLYAIGKDREDAFKNAIAKLLGIAWRQLTDQLDNYIKSIEEKIHDA